MVKVHRRVYNAYRYMVDVNLHSLVNNICIQIKCELGTLNITLPCSVCDDRSYKH